ncbi:MAG: zinc ribbon domain-containing protein [Deltaproteobacteria bacterium]|nr:zinc ribbon domain-containing protein [Deltaproteobacteria bacterium]
MPIYEYEILNEDGTPKGVFETMQKMSEPPLVRHPVTREPVRRILSRTFVGSGQSSGSGDHGTNSCATGACDCSGGSCGWD